MALVFPHYAVYPYVGWEKAHHQKLSMVHLHVGLSKNPLVEGWQSSQRSENLQWRSSISYSLDLRVSRCQFLTLLHVLEFCLQPGETRICGGYAHIYIYTHTCIHIQYTYTVGWLYTLLEIVWLKAPSESCNHQDRFIIHHNHVDPLLSPSHHSRAASSNRQCHLVIFWIFLVWKSSQMAIKH